MVQLARPASILLLASVLLVGLPACGGGGGGGGGGKGGPGPGAGAAVKFTGFAFRFGDGVLTTTPPMEDNSTVPTTPGAGLNVTVIFKFDDEPSGPFDSLSLPVFTTPSEVTPDAGALAGSPIIPAKGTYTLVGNDVEFRPFIPTAPLQVTLSAPPAAVPGFLPASTYTARVSAAVGTKIDNLNTDFGGVSNEVKFGLTSNPAAFYPSDPAASDPPALTAAVPTDGATDFQPGTFATMALGSSTPLFPTGPGEFELTFDRPVLPTQANIMGSDLDGDGAIETSFFLSARATPVVVSHTIPQDALGTHAAFPALSGFDSTDAGVGAPDGSDVFLHGSLDGGLPTPDAGLSTAPDGLASGRDASLLFTLFKMDGGNDFLSVADHVLGDPSAAAMALDGGAATPALVDTGLDDLVGITSLLDGRLVGFDQTTARIYELMPDIVRRRYSPASPSVLAPLLTSVTLGDGVTGFMSDVWPGAVSELHDLAQAPSGILYALATVGGESFPSILRLSPIDLDLNGVFGSGEGVFSGDAVDVVLGLTSAYSAIEFVSETEVLALNRSDDTIDRVDLSLGKTGVAISDVAAFGLPLASFPDGLSPAKALSVGTMLIDTDVGLTSNSASGATVLITAQGILPVGADLTLYQRNNFTSLAGTSEVNADLGDPRTPIGAKAMLSVRTADPTAGPAAAIDDVFLEEFDSVVFEDEGVLSDNPKAEWALSIPGGGTTSGLRASVGVAESAQLGDFLPQAASNFDPSKAYLRAKLPWVGAHLVTDHAESLLDLTQTNFEVILLDTDVQQFPLPSGATPGALGNVTVLGGHFVFRDFIIPEGVHVVAKGSKPLRITAVGKVEIHGILDVSGTNGLGDDSFDSGFLPVRGGPGGAGGGRGGDAQPSLFDPNGAGTLDQFVSPERAQRGLGPVIGSEGTVSFQEIGGHGGLVTAGYDPNAAGFPKTGVALPAGPVPNSEHHRPPGGGGGTYYFRGEQAHEGTGAYFVQSSSTYFPFSKCATNNKIDDATYGNEERRAQGFTPPPPPLQCVYMDGDRTAPNRFKPGGLPGDLVFADGNPNNDFIGATGEIPFLLGGQGGGGGGSRLDSLQHGIWGVGPTGLPVPPPAPPFFPALFINNTYFAPSLFDGKGGGGGGGGGGVEIRSFTSILVSRTGHIDASGGSGGGGEVVQNSNVGGGGGGGSGGAILLQAAEGITIEADPSHLSANFIDKSGDQGAGLDVSGGFGRDAQTLTPSMDYDLKLFTGDWSRSDGGQGGFGLIQLQTGNGTKPVVEEGAFLFAWQRSVAKYGGWNLGASFQKEHGDFTAPFDPNKIVDQLRYVDLLDYRQYKPDNAVNRYYVLNGSYPPIISSTDGDDGQGLINEFPVGSGKFWADTTMTSGPLSQGEVVVRDPAPQVLLETYDGFDPLTMKETNPNNMPPGTLYPVGSDLPMPIALDEPGGTVPMVTAGGQQVFDPANLINRLPVVHPDLTPPPFGTTSVGVSRWLDFNGVAVRVRDGSGRPPPFFEAVKGTYHASAGVPVPPGKEGQVILSSGSIPGKPLKPVQDTVGNPTLDGLAGVPKNDIKVDSPDFNEANVVSNNSTVTLEFQAAYAVRPGSHVPDSTTLTAWVPDLTDLSGMPLVRFRMVFDVGADVINYPFGVDSYRPQADYVRLRTTY